MSNLGLVVEYDGKQNYVYFNSKVQEYAIGGLAAEYARLHPTELKKHLMDCPNYFEKTTLEGANAAKKWLVERLFSVYPTVTATMIVIEFTNLLESFLFSEAEAQEHGYTELNKKLKTNRVSQYIMNESGFSEFGGDYIGQLYLSVYDVFASAFVSFKHSFMLVVSDETTKDKWKEHIDTFFDFYLEHTEFQHIDYKLTLFGGSFHSVYTIQSSMSLILFEAAHMIENGGQIVKCRNCGEYFVPSGRSDSIYCDYPSPQNPSKTCKEIGAQVTRAKKEQTDRCTKEYRRVYMRLKMLCRRHPDNEIYAKQLETLTAEGRVWRKELKEDEKKEDEFLKWLTEFKEGGGCG